MKATSALCLGMALTAASDAVKAGSPDPAYVVTAVVKLDSGGGSALFDDKPAGLMRRYFTRSFVSAWTTAFEHNKDGPFLDGDPITGYQTVQSVSVRQIRVTSRSESEAFIATSLAMKWGGPPKTLRVGFKLQRESGIWKIDDISNDTQASLRGYLAASSHN